MKSGSASFSLISRAVSVTVRYLEKMTGPLLEILVFSGEGVEPIRTTGAFVMKRIALRSSGTARERGNSFPNGI
jgi:hypothetical protein